MAVRRWHSNINRSSKNTCRHEELQDSRQGSRVRGAGRTSGLADSRGLGGVRTTSID